MGKCVWLYFFVSLTILCSNAQDETNVKIIKQVSLVFVIDNTGSMRNDIAAVRIGTRRIMEEFLSREHNPIKTWILSVFNDPDIPPVFVTEDTELFKKKIDEITVKRGGDCPELSIGGIKQAVESALPGSYIYVFTDASAKDYNLAKDVEALAVKKDCQITFVLTGKCSRNPNDPLFLPYLSLAKATGGELFELRRKTEVQQVLNFVKDSLDTKNVHVIKQKLQPGVATVLEVDINDDITKLIVVVTGQSPNIVIKDPTGKTIEGQTIMSLPTTKVKTVPDPIVGKWKITVSANSIISEGQIIVNSDIDFNIGFSPSLVNSISETFDKPVEGINNYIYIEPKPKNTWTPDRVHVIGLDGKIIHKANVKPTGTSGLFVTPEFILPNEVRVVVFGKDSKGNPVQRVTKGVIKTQPPEPIKILNNEKTVTITVNVNENINLECFVTGTKPIIHWKKGESTFASINNKRVSKENRNQIVVISKAEYSDSGTYECSAINNLGSAKKNFQVLVEGPAVIKNPTPEYHLIKVGEKISFTCDVDGKPKPTIEWKKDGVITASNLGNVLISKAAVKDSGTYICTANNKHGSQTKKVVLEVSEPKWSEWDEWTQCSTTCDAGVKSRTRLCYLPSKKNERSLSSKECSGFDKEIAECKIADCNVDGGWSKWSEYSQCSVTCGKGWKERSRKCNNPAPKGKGQYCEGLPTMIEDCLLDRCVYKWNEWTKWSECTKTCGGGTKTRSRTCLIPEDGNEESGSCMGNSKETENCNVQNCPVDGGWTSWSRWSPCSEPCGLGTKERKRSCTKPAPMYGGKKCVGKSTMKKTCFLKKCDESVGWSNWEEWSPCTVSCGVGNKYRRRYCINPSAGGKTCVGARQEVEKCAGPPCPIHGQWSNWSTWNECSVTCGYGLVTRNRKCDNPAPKYGGRDCSGDSSETKSCMPKICPPKEIEVNIYGTLNDESFDEVIKIIPVMKDGVSSFQVKTKDIIHNPDHWFPHLPLLLQSVGWDLAWEENGALNGLSITRGVFNMETDIEFNTGQSLNLKQRGSGVSNGSLKIGVFVKGNVPDAKYGTKFVFPFLSEKFYQIGEGKLYSSSEGNIDINDVPIKYSITHLTSYDSSDSPKLPLVQSFLKANVTNSKSGKDISMGMGTKVSIINESTCPKGFTKDVKNNYCNDIDECDSTNSCEQQCFNDVGGYHCECDDDFELDEDGYKCIKSGGEILEGE